MLHRVVPPKAEVIRATRFQNFLLSFAPNTFPFRSYDPLLISVDIAARFGGDCTTSALENRFRRIKKDAKLINDSIAKGIDPITLPIGDTDGEVAVRRVKSGPGQMKSSSNFPCTLHISFLFNSSHCAYHFEEVFIDIRCRDC